MGDRNYPQIFILRAGCRYPLAGRDILRSAISPPPATASPPSASAQKSAAPDFSKEPIVIEKFLTTIRFENDGTGEREQQLRARVQNQIGVQQLSELVFSYNEANEQVEMRHLRVEKTDGTIATATDKDVKDVTAQIANDAPAYTDLKEKHITVPALAPGVIVDYDVVTHITKPLAPNEFWYKHHFAQQIIVLDEELEINVPAARRINLAFHRSAFHAGRARRPQNLPLEARATLSTRRRSKICQPEKLAEKESQTAKNPPAIVELSSFATWND